MGKHSVNELLSQYEVVEEHGWYDMAFSIACQALVKIDDEESIAYHIWHARSIEMVELASMSEEPYETTQ